MNKIGIRHSIRCNCILSQHMTKINPPLFYFLAFSVIEDDVVKPKIVQCPNCGILHRVTDISRSTVLLGKEDTRAILTLDDIKTSLSANLVKIMQQYELDNTQWEQAKFIVENEKWGEHVILTTEVVENTKHGKYVNILGKELFRIETYEVEA